MRLAWNNKLKEKETLKDTLESPVKGRQESEGGSLNLRKKRVFSFSVVLFPRFRKMCFN